MGKFFTRNLFAVILLLLTGAFLQKANATHIMGSDISFNCLGGNQYQVVVKVYRDCSGTQPATSISVEAASTCASQFVTCTLISGTGGSGVEVSQLCPGAISTCSGGSYPGVQLYTYTGTVTIQPNCGLYTFTYSDCCRNTSNNLLDPFAPSLEFSAHATLNSNLVNCDNAPTFTSLPVPYFCVNQPVNYSHGAIDTDGDSLSYQLIAPLDQSGNALTYQGTYSPTNPLPTASGFNFDQSTGQMSFTPTQQGVYVVDVLVNEYRNGILIGSTMRDIQIVIINCSNNAPNISNSLTLQNVSGAVVNGPNSLGVCPGQTVRFTLFGFDPDGQPITVTSNIANAIPGATLSTVNVGTGADSIQTTFLWTPSGVDTGFRYFTVQFEDNACPIPGLQLFTYYLTVLNGTEAGPNQYYCTGGGPATVHVYGGNHFSWTPTTGIVSATPDSSTLTFAPNGTTTYVVTSDLLGGCKNRDTVTVFNVPTFSTHLTTPDDTICLNSSTNLTATGTPTNQGPFTYSWSPVIAGGVQSPNAQTTQVRPTSNTTYHVTVTSASGCPVKDSIKVIIQGVGPKVTVVPSANYVCPGTTVTLNTAVSAVSCGPVADPANPCLPNSTFVLQDLGTGGNTGTNNTTPYTGFYMDGRVQYLYRASELQALGLGAGAITDIAFNVATKASTIPYNDLSIKMGCTSLDELPASYVTNGLSTVLNPAPYTTATGWNTHTFDVPYNWDGFSNLIIEVCYDNNSYTGYDAVTYTPTTFNNSVLWADQDLSTSSGCTGINTPALGTNRPNTRFIQCKAPLNNYSFTWTGSDGSTLPDTSAPSVPVSHDINYSVVVSDGTCTGDTTIKLYTDTAVAITAGPDLAICNGSTDSVQINAHLLHPAILQCVNGYTLSSIPYNALSATGTINAGPVGDDVVSNAVTLAFPFNYFCNQVTQYFISTNGFINFGSNQGAGCCSGQAIPDIGTPNGVVALCWEDLNTSLGGIINYYTVGTAPNRIEVISFNNVSFFGGGGTVKGQIQLYEGTNVIEVHVGSQTATGQTATLGIEDATGAIGYSPIGYNAASWTVSTPVAFRFTPQAQGNVITHAQWTPSAGLSNDTILNPKAFVTSNTTYVLTATFLSGCVTTDTVKVGIGNFPYSVAISADTICPGDSAHLVFTGNGVSFNWTPTNGLNTPTSKSPWASPTVTTKYYVTAFDSVGCRGYDSLSLAVRTHAPITIGGDTAICPYDSVILAPNGGPYTSYLWSTGSTASSIGTGAQTASSQNYFVKVNDGHCFFNSDTISVNEFVLSPIVVNPSGDTSLCNGDTLLLTADAGYNVYHWSNGATSQTITINVAGQYSYLAIDSHGCVLKSVDTAAVSIVTPPAANILTTSDSVCTGQSNVILSVTPVSGIVYTWKPGNVVDTTYTAAASGVYTLLANDNGCKNYDTITVYAVDPPILDLGPDIGVCQCDSGVPLTSSVTGHYVWSTGDSVQTISALQSGTYTLTVTDRNNCTATDLVVVNIHCLRVDAVVADPATGTVLSGHNAVLDVTSTSYTSTFTYLWTPPSYLDDSSKKSPAVQAPQNTTTYLVQVTDVVNGCIAYDTVLLAVVPPGIPPMPNAFSPNGDGLNDTYGPYFPGAFAGLYTVNTFRVYNRWGQLIYNGTGPWDGTFNGVLQPAGTYEYYITMTGPDQNNPNVNIQYNLVGSFTLLH